MYGVVGFMLTVESSSRRHLSQWFSGFAVPQNRLEVSSFIKHQLLDSTQQGFLVSRSGANKFPDTLLLLVRRPHFKNHWFVEL